MTRRQGRLLRALQQRGSLAQDERLPCLDQHQDWEREELEKLAQKGLVENVDDAGGCPPRGPCFWPGQRSSWKGSAREAWMCSGREPPIGQSVYRTTSGRFDHRTELLALAGSRTGRWRHSRHRVRGGGDVARRLADQRSANSQPLVFVGRPVYRDTRAFRRACAARTIGIAWMRR